MLTPITREQVTEKLAREDVVLVEALPVSYYEDLHLPSAINIPHDEIDRLAPTMLPDRDAQVVVYCSNAACQNSTIAARRLTELGYRNVFDYEAGKQDWVETGLPTESGRGASSSQDG